MVRKRRLSALEKQNLSSITKLFCLQFSSNNVQWFMHHFPPHHYPCNVILWKLHIFMLNCLICINENAELNFLLGEYDFKNYVGDPQTDLLILSYCPVTLLVALGLFKFFKRLLSKLES